MRDPACEDPVVAEMTGCPDGRLMTASDDYREAARLAADFDQTLQETGLAPVWSITVRQLPRCLGGRFGVFLVRAC